MTTVAPEIFGGRLQYPDLKKEKRWQLWQSVRRVWAISSLKMMLDREESANTLSDCCPYAKATKESDRKTEFKVSSGKGHFLRAYRVKRWLLMRRIS
jgi:hypothetical protein